VKEEEEKDEEIGKLGLSKATETKERRS